MKKLPWIQSIKFLCFDVDGTLYRDVLAAWEAIQSQIYGTVMEHRKCSLSEAQKYVRRRYQKLGSSTKILNELGIDGQEFFNRSFSAIDLKQYVSPEPKLLRLLNKLRPKYRLGIISNNSRAIVSKKLDAIGIPLNIFDPIVTTYELGVMKPDPDPFLKALELARVSPDEAIYIGDKEETDILGAKAVGMRTIMVWGKSKHADLSIPTIYSLERILLGVRQGESLK